MIKKILSNKKAIITGANQGLGLEIARKFVLAGADLMICARNGNMLEDARNELIKFCLLYTSPSPRDAHESRMPSSA